MAWEDAGKHDTTGGFADQLSRAMMGDEAHDEALARAKQAQRREDTLWALGLLLGYVAVAAACFALVIGCYLLWGAAT